ncbi:MAG: zinc-dependent metalloprotease family protein, partial [Flavobacteriaceae bacterium]|nr:zinc-dependent metalloprotease family protein [Flavobacteriaceae bacterium]
MKQQLFLALVLALLFQAPQALAQNTNSQRAQELPRGHEFKSAFNGLPPQAKAKAQNWLDTLDEIPYEDFDYLKVDQEGNVLYADSFNSETSGSTTNGNTSPAIEEVTASEVFTLHSKPGASKVVYIDFDGHVLSGTAWNNSAGVSTLYARPYDSDGNENSFSSAEITDMAAIWHRVAEDYAPFDIDVTTQEPSSFGPNVSRILITNRTDSRGEYIYKNSAGGVAYVNVWGLSNYEYYQPALVFYNHLGTGNAHNLAEAASHELGHNLSLSHDGTSTT